MTRSRPVSVSFEFFPPGDEAMEKTLWESIRYLEPLNPSFVSVTYGADGSTRERTHNVVSRLQTEHSLNCVPHLTCIGASRGEVLDIARLYWDQGIRHIVALRGDPPPARRNTNRVPMVSPMRPTWSRASRPSEISKSRWPRIRKGHPEAPSFEFDLGNLKRKIDAGATRAITQFFYDTDLFLRFRDRCAARGIDAPIVPGILPITRFPQITRFAKRCGASIPDWLEHRFDGLEDNPETRKLISAAVAIEQVHTLQRHGVEQFHFYTLNRSELTYAICHALGVRPRVERKVASA